MTEVNEALILYRLDELKTSVDEIKVDLKDHVKTANERDAVLEERIRAVEPRGGRVAGGVTGGVAGAAVLFLAYAAEWIRSRFGV